MSVDEYMSTRLGEMLADLRVRQPEPETEQLSSGDRLLSTDPALWEMVQQHRQATYAAEVLRQEQREVMEALTEAAEATGMSSWELEERLYQANHARGASAPLDFDGQYPVGRTRAQLDEEQRQRMAAEEAAFQEIVAGNRQMIAREEARAAAMRGDPVPGNHSEEVPAADA